MYTSIQFLQHSSPVPSGASIIHSIHPSVLPVRSSWCYSLWMYICDVKANGWNGEWQLCHPALEFDPLLFPLDHPLTLLSLRRWPMLEWTSGRMDGWLFGLKFYVNNKVVVWVTTSCLPTHGVNTHRQYGTQYIYAFALQGSHTRDQCWSSLSTYFVTQEDVRAKKGSWKKVKTFFHPLSYYTFSAGPITIFSSLFRFAVYFYLFPIDIFVVIL